MRTTLLPLAILLLTAPVRAQLTAGEVPEGSVAYDANIDLILDGLFVSDSADVELDCDDFVDVRALLYRGAPEVDVPHVASLHFVDDNIEVCMDMATGSQQRPMYYAFGEPMVCSGDFDWQLADELVLGDIGGFLALGPWSVDSMYIAYRQGTSVGWILLSFDLGEGDDTRLQIHQVLSVCQDPTSVADHEGSTGPVLFPNPSDGGTIRVESPTELRYLEVLDATGRLVAQYNGNVRTIAAPPVAGSYFVRATYADGRRNVARFVRQ